MSTKINKFKIFFLSKIKTYILLKPFSFFLNILFLASIISIILVSLNWIFFNANWSVINSNLSLFAFGSYPPDEQWRPSLWLVILSFIAFITIYGPKRKWLRKNLLFIWIGTVPLGIFLLKGGFGLIPVMSQNWGGLTLTILITSCSILFSLPFGILLALGRRSSLFVIRKSCSFYIDIMRSIPLIAVLFFGQLLIPLFLPYGLEIDRVWRAIIGFTLFVSAYIAEDIRGGLQSIPKTQLEAANSLGLNKYQITRFILIPQSLRVALPALTNQVIGLFQNTSLMSILGLMELIGIGRSILANPEYIGQYIEVYIWLAIVYWILCTLMAFLSKQLEKKMSTNKGY